MFVPLRSKGKKKHYAVFRKKIVNENPPYCATYLYPNIIHLIFVSCYKRHFDTREWEGDGEPMTLNSETPVFQRPACPRPSHPGQ